MELLLPLEGGASDDLKYLRGLLSKPKKTIDLSMKRFTEDSKPLLHFAGNGLVATFSEQKCGAEDNATDRHGCTALHENVKITDMYACTIEQEQCKNSDICEFLTQEVGTNENVCDNHGHICIRGLFFLAVAGDDYARLRDLFELYPDQVNVNEDTDGGENDYGCNLFQMAVSRNQLDIVKYMIEEQGADVNAPTYEDERPICDADSVEMIQYLLDKGTDLAQIVDEDTDEMPLLTTVLVRAVKLGSLDLIRRIMTEYNIDGDAWVGSESTPLVHCIAENGNMDIIRYLIEERHANPHSRRLSGETVLHCAGTIEVAEYLITHHGVDPDLVDDDGHTAALTWLNRDKFEQVQWLIRHFGVDLHWKNNFGATLHNVAEEFGETESDFAEGGLRTSEKAYRVRSYFDLLYKTLEAIGRDDGVESLRNLVNDYPHIDRAARNQDGNTWFLQACQANNLDQAKFWLLEDKQADLTDAKAQNNRGETALHLAAQHGNLSFLQWLVEQGGSDWLRNATDKKGRTVLHSACQAGHVPVMEWLVGKHGLDLLHPRDCDGHSALDCAIDAGQLDVMVWYNISPLGLKRAVWQPPSAPTAKPPPQTYVSVTTP
eukprot:scaffold24048_cov194-Amphora_coffeaeformis.AAC.22